MATKIIAIACGVCWAIFGISFLFGGPSGGLTDTGPTLFFVGYMSGFLSLIALAILALIDYARRPR